MHWAPEGCLSRKFQVLPNLAYIKGDIKPRDAATKKLDITDVDLPNESVDVMLCSHVLEHIPDDHKAMTELLRVLKPGGYVIALVPLYIDLEKTYEDPSITNQKMRALHFDQSDHVRKYGPDFVTRLQIAGFSVEQYPLSRLSSEQRERFGMTGYDDDARVNAARGADIYLCVKKELKT